MDVNTLRVIATVAAFALFTGILYWACARRNRADFEAAAQLPFEQD